MNTKDIIMVAPDIVRGYHINSTQQTEKGITHHQ